MSLGELTYQAFAQAISSYAANDIFSLLNYLTFRCDRSSRWIPNKVTVLSWRSSDKHVQSLSVGGASSLGPSFPLPTLLAGLTAAKLGKNFRESPAPVPGKFGPGKKYRSRYRKKLVPEKSTGTGIGKNWSRKKYRYRYWKKLVPEKSTGTGIGKNWSQYRRIPGNSRSLYILISSCTFRHWEKEISL